MSANAFDDLRERGFIYQCTDEDAVRGALGSGPVTFYVGFDPTADSLHVGHLLPIMAMRRLQMAGHRPIVLVGGATALVGDPSGKQEARPILSNELVARNVAALRSQLGRFISVEDDDAEFADNADWFSGMRYLDFLRDVGSRFSVNRMLGAESVRQRLETGLSFLEFNYMLLQAYDFFILNRDRGCLMQFGGQDQWGNIVAGVELTRRMSSAEVYGMTFPLLLNSQGQKFGKTAAGAVWLDKSRTPVFDYYQFWRNSDDADVARLLNLFTNLPVGECRRLGALPAPAINRAKEILAFEATALAHGLDEARKNYLGAGSKFGFADPDAKIATSSGIAAVAITVDGSGDLPTHSVAAAGLAGDGVWIVKVFADAGLCQSNGEARRLIKGGGAYLNGERLSEPDRNLTAADFIDGAAVIRAGKKNVRRLVLAE